MAAQQSIKIPTELYEVIKAEAEARSCFIHRVISDAMDAYRKSRKRGK